MADTRGEEGGDKTPMTMVFPGEVWTILYTAVH